METIDKKQDVSYEYNANLTPAEYMIWGYGYDNYINIESVKKWLQDPMTYNKQLRFLSNYFYNLNGIYTNVIDYTVSIPTLDRVVFGSNKNHTRFKKNKKKFVGVLKSINDKLITRDILFKLALEGISFNYFETNESDILTKRFLTDSDIHNIQELNSMVNYSVMPLPTDYCRIVGFSRKNSSYVVAFDMSYFDQFISNGLSRKLRCYPKEIRDKYKIYTKDRNKKWAILDNNKTITVKVRAKRDELWGRPLGLAAYVDMLYDDYFTQTKRNVLDDVNNTIIYQTFPEGEKKGVSSLTQDQQEMQHNNIKKALFSKGFKHMGINFFSVASGTKLDKLTTNTDILKTESEPELIKRISTDLGFAGSALNGEDSNFSSQQMNIELVTREVLTWLEQIQEEYNKVINANAIKDIQCPIDLYYIPTTIANQKEFVGYMKDLYTMGKGSLQMWIAATGINPQAYLALMDEELEEDFENKYPLHKTSYTQSNDSGGRPENDDPTNKNTIVSKTNDNDIRP